MASECSSSSEWILRVSQTLTEEALCSSLSEAETIVATCLEDGEYRENNHERLPDNLLAVLRQGLPEYLGISEQEANRVIERASTPSKGDTGNTDDDDEHSTATDDHLEEIDNDSMNDYLQDGECELCERSNIRLTKHHLIPRSTWSRMEAKLEWLLERHEVLHHDNEHGIEHLIPLIHKQQNAGKSVKRCIKQVLQEQMCYICRACHSTVHRTHDNLVLAAEYNTVERLLNDDKIRAFCKWAHTQRPGKHAIHY